MKKDDMETECMNELFNNGEHWKPVAIYDEDDDKIRDLTKEEQLALIRQPTTVSEK